MLMGIWRRLVGRFEYMDIERERLRIRRDTTMSIDEKIAVIDALIARNKALELSIWSE